MEIKIKGSEADVKKFLKTNRLFMKRNKLRVVEDEKVEKEVKLTAVQVAELIAKVEKLEDLKQYESDERQVVKAAYVKRLKELE